MIEPSPASAASAHSDPQSLELELESSLAAERRGATRSASIVRLAAALVTLGIIFTRWAISGGDDTWARAMIPVSVYVLGALGFFVLRNVPAAVRLAWLTGLVDVAAVSVILLGVSLGSPVAPAVATFTLGLFALIVASSSLTLARAYVFITAAAASLCESWLLLSTGIDWGLVAISWVVLFAVAAMTQLSGGRLRTVIMGLTRAQIDRRLEALRVEALSREKDRIETELVDSHAHNDALVALQQAKETLAQVLVHDLRSPVSAVMASLDLIRQELETSALRPDLQRSAAEALKTAERLAGMINDLLDVARLEEGRLQPQRAPLEAADMCSEVHRYGALLPRGRRLSFEAEVEGGLWLEADRDLLVRMLENLVANAVRFAARRVRISGVRDGSDIVFRIQNDGPPISPVLQLHLFEKFAQLERRDGGWGLGLYFCRLAAEVHGGSVGVEADPSWNVSFVLRMPARTQHEEGHLAA